MPVAQIEECNPQDAEGSFYRIAFGTIAKAQPEKFLQASRPMEEGFYQAAYKLSIPAEEVDIAQPCTTTRQDSLCQHMAQRSILANQRRLVLADQPAHL